MVIVLMGVTASGKTTVGTLLARDLGWDFYDADDYHSAANIEKMRHGVPLTDEDRQPWLAALNALLQARTREQRNVVLACSALKDGYRETLAAGVPDVRFVHLHASPSLIAARLAARQGHFMNPALLDSQFAVLEEPRGALDVDASLSPAAIVSTICRAYGL